MINHSIWVTIVESSQMKVMKVLMFCHVHIHLNTLVKFLEILTRNK